MSDWDMNADIGVDSETLGVIVSDVFAGLFGEDGEGLFPSAAVDTLPVTAKVAIDGAWNGQVAFSCTEPLAHRMTAQMLDSAPADVDDGDIRDAVGEIVNIIGGNVKSVVPGPSTLSLPQTTLQATDGTDASDTLRLELAWMNEPIRISVWHNPAVNGTPTPSEESPA